MIDKDTLFLNIKDKIPSDSLEACKESIDNASAEELSKIALLNIKNPIIALLLSLFIGLFGADRFYKGDIKLGILKPALFFGSYFLLIIFLLSFEYELRSEYSIGLLSIAIVLFLIMMAVLIWAIADIFLVYFGIKKDNLTKIYSVFSK